MTEMNRQQRRQGKRPESVQPAQLPETGDVRRQLAQPVRVGELTVSDANEIRTVNALLKKWDEDLEHARKTRAVVAMYRQQMLDKLITERNLDKRNVYSLDDESGLIVQTHEFVDPAPGVLEVVSTEPEEG